MYLALKYPPIKNQFPIVLRNVVKSACLLYPVGQYIADIVISTVTTAGGLYVGSVVMFSLEVLDCYDFYGISGGLYVRNFAFFLIVVFF